MRARDPRLKYPFHRLARKGDMITIRRSDVRLVDPSETRPSIIFHSPRESAHAYAGRHGFLVSTRMTAHGSLLVERT